MSSIKKKDLKYNLHSWSAQGKLDPIVITKAEGIYFWDEEGKRYADMSSQLVNSNLGHGNKAIADAIAKQAHELSFIGPSFALGCKSDAAEAIVKATGFADGAKVFFANAGAEANENAIKIARQYTGKYKIFSQYRSYHGSSAGSGMLTGEPRRFFNEPGNAGFIKYDVPYPYRVPKACHFESDDEIADFYLELLENQILYEGPDTIAAIWFESVVGSNGVIIAKFSIPPFIVTLGTQVIAWGVNLLYFDLPPNSSQPIGGVKGSITYMGSGLLFGKIPVIILIALVVTVVVWFILKKLRFGRNVYAVGGNAEAANVSGIKVSNTLIGVYAIAGLLYGLAGFLECARTGGATSAYGLNYEFDAIASCVVGGVSNTGGIGTVPGMIVGVMIFGIINYGLTFIGVNPYWQQIIKGVIIIAAVGFDIRKNLRRK